MGTWFWNVEDLAATPGKSYGVPTGTRNKDLLKLQFFESKTRVMEGDNSYYAIKTEVWYVPQHWDDAVYPIDSAWCLPSEPACHDWSWSRYFLTKYLATFNQMGTTLFGPPDLGYYDIENWPTPSLDYLPVAVGAVSILTILGLLGYALYERGG